MYTKNFAVMKSFNRIILNENVWLFWKSIDYWFGANKDIFSFGYVEAMVNFSC